MAESGIPYMAAYGAITRTLEAIQKAQTPDRFTQDFLATRLAVKGGTAKPVIPFLKKTGFLSSDGTPTGLYKRFRNQAQSRAAAAEALRTGYAKLYEINEYAHDLNDNELKGIIVQATGIDEGASTVKSIIGSFKALRAFADFNAPTVVDAVQPDRVHFSDERVSEQSSGALLRTGLNFGYTINLHLPATADIAVYNAIFKSVREHLLGSAP